MAEKLKAKVIFSQIPETKTFKTNTSPIPNMLTAKAILDNKIEPRGEVKNSLLYKTFHTSYQRKKPGPKGKLTEVALSREIKKFILKEKMKRAATGATAITQVQRFAEEVKARETVRNNKKVF